jgi:hypothetical protein
MARRVRSALAVLMEVAECDQRRRHYAELRQQRAARREIDKRPVIAGSSATLSNSMLRRVDYQNAEQSSPLAMAASPRCLKESPRPLLPASYASRSRVPCGSFPVVRRAILKNSKESSGRGRGCWLAVFLQLECGLKSLFAKLRGFCPCDGRIGFGFLRGSHVVLLSFGRLGGFGYRPKSAAWGSFGSSGRVHSAWRVRC